MNKSKKLLAVLCVVLSVAALLTSVSLTYALWSATSGGESGIAPAVQTYDWNAYLKYFEFEAYDASGNRLYVNAAGNAITDGEGNVLSSDDEGNVNSVKNGANINFTVSYFSVVGFSGVNLEQVVFPKEVTYLKSGVPNVAPVTIVGNTIFDGLTVAQLPLSVIISPSVSEIREGAFQNAVNLKSIVFAATDSEDRGSIDVKQFAFGGCTALESVRCDGKQTIGLYPNAFIGCAKLESFAKNTCTLNYVGASTTALSAANFASVFAGCANSYATVFGA